MTYLVSIIIPVYNVEKEYLVACIDSVINQTYSFIEIILVDDGSTNPWVSPTLQEFKEKDSRIKIIRKENEGVVYARQRGIDESSGKYILFLDCDDFITPNAIELLYKKALENDSLVVIGDHWMLYEGGEKKWMKLSMPEGKNAYLKALLCSRCNGTVWAKLFKRDVFQRINMLSITNEKKDNDIQFNYLMAAKLDSEKIICLGEPVYYWLQRKNSTTQSQIKISDNSAFDQIKWKNEFVKDHFDIKEIENELALSNLSTWALLLSWGMKCPDKSLRDEMYQVYWKNKSARNQLSRMKRIIILSDKNLFVSFIYRLYQSTVKPMLKRHFLRIYIKNT